MTQHNIFALWFGILFRQHILLFTFFRDACSIFLFHGETFSAVSYGIKKNPVQLVFLWVRPLDETKGRDSERETNFNEMHKYILFMFHLNILVVVAAHHVNLFNFQCSLLMAWNNWNLWFYLASCVNKNTTIFYAIRLAQYFKMLSCFFNIQNSHVIINFSVKICTAQRMGK